MYGLSHGKLQYWIYFEIVKLIGDNLENKNPLTHNGDTPQSLAENNGHTEIVTYFKRQKKRRTGGLRKK